MRKANNIFVTLEEVTLAGGTLLIYWDLSYDYNAIDQESEFKFLETHARGLFKNRNIVTRCLFIPFELFF